MVTWSDILHAHHHSKTDHQIPWDSNHSQECSFHQSVSIKKKIALIESDNIELSSPCYEIILITQKDTSSSLTSIKRSEHSPRAPPYKLI